MYQASICSLYPVVNYQIGEKTEINLEAHTIYELIDLSYELLTKFNFLLNGGIHIPKQKSHTIIYLNNYIRASKTKISMLCNTIKNTTGFTIATSQRSIELDTELILHKKLTKQIINAITSNDNSILKLIQKINNKETNFTTYNRNNITLTKKSFKTKIGILKLPVAVEFHNNNFNSVSYPLAKFKDIVNEKILLQGNYIFAIFINKNTNYEFINKFKHFVDSITNTL